mmetsp:Transcript_45569/g.84453  ORF Transcript_45569/g.84453 Transcript_45569/m.84453 type:complete len:208 (+) Transcript_45569:650-1273(+)
MLGRSPRSMITRVTVAGCGYWKEAFVKLAMCWMKVRKNYCARLIIYSKRGTWHTSRIPWDTTKLEILQVMFRQLPCTSTAHHFSGVRYGSIPLTHLYPVVLVCATFPNMAILFDLFPLLSFQMNNSRRRYRTETVESCGMLCCLLKGECCILLINGQMPSTIDVYDCTPFESMQPQTMSKFHSTYLVGINKFSSITTKQRVYAVKSK